MDRSNPAGNCPALAGPWGPPCGKARRPPSPESTGAGGHGNSPTGVYWISLPGLPGKVRRSPHQYHRGQPPPDGPRQPRGGHSPAPPLPKPPLPRERRSWDGAWSIFPRRHRARKRDGNSRFGAAEAPILDGKLGHKVEQRSTKPRNLEHGDPEPQAPRRRSQGMLGQRKPVRGRAPHPAALPGPPPPSQRGAAPECK